MPKKVTANGLKFTFDDNATDEEIQEALSNYFDNIPQKENTEKKKDISSNGVENSLGGKSYIENTNQEWNTRLGKETDFTRSVAGGKLPTLDINNTQQQKSVVQSFIETNIPEQYRTKEVLGRANNIIKTSNPKEAAKKLIQLKTEIDENDGNILTAKKALQDDSLLKKNKSLDYNAQVLDIFNNEKIKYLDDKIANGGDNILSEYEENIILENAHKQALQTEAGQRRLKVQEASQDIKKAVEEDYNYFKDVIQKIPFSPQTKKYLEEKAGELKNDILDPTTNTEALTKYIGLKKSILDKEYKKKLDSEIGDVSFMGSKDYGRLIQEQIPTERQKQLENDYNESLISLQETLLPIAQVKATQQVISEAKAKNVLPSTHKIGEIVLGVMNLPEYDKAIRMKKEGIPYTPQQLFEMDRMGNEALKNFVSIYKPDADNGDEVAKDLVKLANSKIATRDEVLKRNPEYLKEQYSRLISDEIAKNPKEYFGATVNGINTSGVQKALGLYDIDDEMINKAGKNLGLDQNIVTKISDEDIKSGNIIGAFTSGIIGEPITGIKGLYQRVKNKAKGYSWETANALADRYTDKEEFFSKIYKTPEADEIQQGATKIDTDPESETYMQDIKNTNAGDWNINAYNLLNSMFYGAGMVIGLGKGGMTTGKLLQGSKAIGTEASLASKAEKTLEAGYKTGRIEEMTKAQEKANILLSKSEKAKEFADNAGMFMYGYITGIDRNLKSAEQLYAGQENAEQKKLLHAGLFSFIENAVEQMGFSEVKFVRNLLSPQNKAMYELVENISKNGIKGVEKKELLDGVKNVIKSGARIGKDISSEVVEEIATNVGGKVIELVTGAKQDEDSNFLKEQFDTAVHTVLQMVLTTGLGEIRQKAPMRETLQMQIALNPYGVIQSIKQQQEAGKITEEEAIKKRKVVNTLVDIYNELPQSDAYSGRRLTKQDRIQYLNEGLKIRLAKNELENIKDEVQKKRLQDIISEAYKKQVEILEKGVPKNKGINPNRVDAERTLEEQTIKAKSDTPILVVEKDGKFEVNNPNGNIETFDTREEADSRVVEISNNNVANTTVGTKIQDNSIEIPIQKIEEINKRNGVKISQKEDGSFDVQLENESDDKIKNNLSIARAQLELAELRDNMRIQNPIFAESGSNENKDIEDTSQYGKLPNGVEFKITRLDNGNYQYNFNDGFEEIYTKEEHEKSVKDKEIEIIDVSELTKPITIVDNKNISSSEQTELVGDKKQVDGVNNKLEEQIQSPQKGVLTDEIYEQYLEDGNIDNDILFSIVENDFMGEELNKKEKTLLNNETDNVRKIQNELLNKFTTDITKDDIEKATGAKGVISKRNKYVIAYKIANRGGKKIKDVLNTKEQILYNERKKEIDKLIKDDPNLFLPKLKEETKEQKEARDKDLEERKKRFEEQQQKLLEGKKTAIGEKMRSAGERISSDGDIIYRQTENVTKDKPKGDIGYVQFAEINGVNIGEEYQYVLIEEDDLQASHTIDYTKANDKHFIIEAQPKDRTGDDKSIKASDRIAQKVDLSKATDSPIAYIGAPIVNDRGEVIQGNNRAIGIKKHYNNKSNQYKNDLADNANKYGFSKEQVLGMNKPVLVRVLKVSDDRAIELGNYVMSDLESASDSTINATRLIAKMSEADKAKLNELLIDEDTEKSITAIITKNKDKILSLIAPYLNDGQISGAVDRNNEVTNEFINEISKVPKAILFDGTTDTQKRAFDKLPTRLQNAILRATPQILSVSRKDNIIDQLAQAIEIYAEYLASGGNIPINVYLNSAQLFRPAINDMLVGEQKFVSKIVQELDNVKYVNDLQPFMVEYAKEINGDPQINLFTGEAISPKNKQEAINKINKENEQQTTTQQRTGGDKTNTPPRGQDDTPTKSNIRKETKSNEKDAKLGLGKEDDNRKSRGGINSNNNPKYQVNNNGRFKLLDRKVFDKFAKRIKQVFPKIKLNVVSEDDIKNILGTIWDNIQQQSNIQTQFLRTPQGTIYGFVKDGQVYINEKELNANTLVHEYSHLFTQILAQQFPSIHKKLIDKILQEKELIANKKKDPNYSTLTDEVLADEVLADLVGDKGEQLLNKKKPLHKELLDLIDKYWNKIKNLFSESSPNIAKWSTEQFKNATIEEIVNNVTADLLSGRKLSNASSNANNHKNNTNDTQIRFKKIDSAQEKVKRNANLLPNTLAVFERPEFKAMHGKEVNPVTIQQNLNKQGIKNIEKEIINDIIDVFYKGKKKISYDEFEASVRANILPLERIETTTYSNYGKENLGDEYVYGDDKTIILNSPIEHGERGHFKYDFKNKKRKNIDFIPKQLNDNVWVAVENGYETQANEENILEFVGTAGSKEAVEKWIYDYNNPTKTDEDVEINVGMFGHIRVWDNGKEFYIAELQSDYFQKHNAKNELIQKPKNKFYIDLFKKQFNLNNKLKKLPKGFEFINNGDKVGIIYEKQTNARPINDKLYNNESEALDLFMGDIITENDMVNFYLYINNTSKYNNVNSIIYNSLSNDEFDNIKVEYKKELNIFKENSYKVAPLYIKQFIASQKEHEKRLLREAIREASLSGAEVLRIPTPRTISIIEGYISNEGKMPYEIVDGNSNYLNNGDIINYLGEDYIVLYSDHEMIDVVSLSEVSHKFNIEDDAKEQAENNIEDIIYELDRSVEDIGAITEDEINNYDGYEEDILKEVLREAIQEKIDNGEENPTIDFDDYRDEIEDKIKERIQDNIEYDPIGYYEKEMGYQKAIEKNGHVYLFNKNPYVETLKQPNEYSATDNEDFDINDLSDTEQTVVRKYEQYAKQLEEEFSDRGVSIVEDENGQTWIEVSLNENDRNKPVVAFQLSTTQDTLPFETNDNTKANKENIQAKFKDAIVVQSESELPQAIQEEIRNQQAKGNVKGVYYNGEVYMVADHIRTIGEATGTYRHERLGHKGVIDYLGNKLNDYTSRIIDNAKDGQLKKLKELAKRYGLPTDISKLSDEQKQLLGEEYIAMISENKAKYPKAWSDLVSFVRKALRKLGIDLEVTDTEIEALLGKVENKILGKKTIIEKISSQVKDFLNSIGIKASKVSLSNIKSRFQFIIPDNAKGDKYNRNNLKKFLSEKEADYIRKNYLSLFSDSDNFIAYAKKYIPIKSNIVPLLEKYGNVVLEDFYNKTYGEKKEEKQEEHLHPKDLLAQVGYQLGDVIDNVDKANELYLDYYLGEGSDGKRGGSIICTLHSGDRFRNYHVMWVIKDNAINQPRAFVLTQENLTDEWKQYLEQKGRKNEDGTYNLKNLKAEREDPFGTSVLSMQINKKGGEHRLINRYNHDLQKSHGDNKNPDRTFDLDLNKLAKGLSKSIYNFFNLKESGQITKDELKGFIQDRNGAFYKYTEEYNGVYYGEGFYIKNGEATILDSGSQKMVDGFVINANGEVENIANKFNEFPYGDIKKVNYIKGNEISIETQNGTFVFETNRGVVSKLISGNDDFIFDKLNNLYIAEKDENGNIILGDVPYDDNKLLHLFWNDKIVKIKRNAYFNNSQITNLGNLQSIGGWADFRNSQITNSGNLQSIGRWADFRNSQITNLGNLQSIGGVTDFRDSQITNLGNLQSIGDKVYFNNTQNNAELLASIKANDEKAKEKADKIKNVFKKAHEDFLESLKNNEGKSFNDFLPDKYKITWQNNISNNADIKFQLNKTSDGQEYLSINENNGEYTNTAPDNIQQQDNETQNSNNIKTVQAVWAKDKNIQFKGTTKIKNADDVAKIMSLLENKAVEHAFAIHIDNKGDSYIQYLSIGGINGTVIDATLILSGVSKFNSSKIYLVHNHPTGNMNPSKQDINITKNIRNGLSPLNIDLEHIIIDTYKKEYIHIDKNDVITINKRGENTFTKKISPIQLTAQEILRDNLGKIQTSKDAFAIIQNFRFGAMPKNAILVLDNANNVIGNYIFNGTPEFKDIITFIGDIGIAKNIILYGNEEYDKNFIKNNYNYLKNLDITLLDVISTSSQNDTVKDYYISLMEEGKFYEDIEKYGTGNDKFKQAKDNLKEAWGGFKNIGFANMPEEQFRKDIKLLKALLDYIVQSGLKNINDIRDAIKKKLNAKSLNKDLEKRIEKAIDIISGASTYSNEVLKSLSNILSDNNIEAVKNLVKQNTNNEVFNIDTAITDIENKRLKRETKDAIIDYLQAVKDEEESNVKMRKRDSGIITDNGNTAMENDSINKILSTEIDLMNFPNIATTFNIDKQITAETTSEVQNRDVDGNYIKITLNELKLISLELSKRLKDTLGNNWEEKVLNYLESRGSSNQATSIAVLNAMSAKNLDEIETFELSDRQYKKLKNIQNRIDKVTNNISRQLSLGLNMRRILREFATQGDIAGAIAETILPKNIREDIEAMKQSISREISDKELNAIGRAVQPENAQEQKTPPQKETNKGELLNIAKSKLGKNGNDKDNLEERAKQIAEKINKTKCK